MVKINSLVAHQFKSTNRFIKKSKYHVYRKRKYNVLKSTQIVQGRIPEKFSWLSLDGMFWQNSAGDIGKRNYNESDSNGSDGKNQITIRTIYFLFLIGSFIAVI